MTGLYKLSASEVTPKVRHKTFRVTSDIFFIIIAWATTSIANAQGLKVVSFEKLLTDVTARSTAVKDGNSDICALIKVSLPVPD